MKSLDKKKTKELDFNDKLYDIWFESLCNGNYQMFQKKVKEMFIQQRTELLEEIKDIEIGEADGWELARKFNCCPGDDMADAYNQALKDVIKLLKKL